MEFFVVISGVGTLILLVVHMLDYFVESKHQTLVRAQLPAPKEAVPAGVACQPAKAVAQFDLAA
jgi:hypothetical protein